MLQIIEGPAYNESMGSNDFRTINNCLWNVLVTMTTVGYGDTYPITNLGRIVNIISSIGGTIFVSLLTLSLQNIMNFTSYEDNAYLYREKMLMDEQKELVAGKYFKTAFDYILARKAYRNVMESNQSYVVKKKYENILKKKLYNKIEKKRKFKEAIQFYRNNYEMVTEADMLKDKLDEFQEGLNSLNVNSKKLGHTVNKIMKLL